MTSDIMVTPRGAASPVAEADFVPVTGKPGVYTVDYQLTFGITDVTFNLIDGYATNAPSHALDVNAPTEKVVQDDSTAKITVADEADGSAELRLT